MNILQHSSIKEKKCSTCGTPFICGDSVDGIACWCNDFPPIFVPSDVVDCMCTNCFTAACGNKIDNYVATILPAEAVDSKAKNLPKTTRLIEGIDYYLENGNYVFKGWFHLKRGHCCSNGCRHCPYGFKKNK